MILSKVKWMKLSICMYNKIVDKKNEIVLEKQKHEKLLWALKRPLLD